MRGFEGHVADFEDADRDRVVFVLAQGFQEARQERGADDLVFCRFRIGKFDSRGAVVGAVEVREIFGMGTEDEGEHFGPAGHCGFCADDVAEFVDGEGLGDGARDVGEGTGEAVETVGDSDIFHDVGLVEHVGACWGDVDVDEVWGGAGGGCCVGHSFQEGANFWGGEGEAAAGVDVGD